MESAGTIYRKNKKIISAIILTIGGILLFIGVTSANINLAALGVFIISLSLYLR